MAELKKYDSFQALKASGQKSNIEAETALLRTFELMDFYIQLNKSFKKKRTLPAKSKAVNTIDWKYL